MSSKIGIYKIISPSGRIYIGQSINIEYAWKYRYKNIQGCKRQPKIYNSLKKYGFEAHDFDIIQECSINELNQWETHWKIYYLAQVQGNWNKVLFCELHDRWTGPKSEETKQKLRGLKRTKEFCENLSIKNKGKIRTEETKLKISESNKGRKISEVTKNKLSVSNLGLKRPNVSLRLKGKPSQNLNNIYSKETKHIMSQKAKNRKQPTNFNKQIFLFYHEILNKTFSGTMYSFFKDFDLKGNDVNAMILGRQKSVKGWKFETI